MTIDQLITAPTADMFAGVAEIVRRDQARSQARNQAEPFARAAERDARIDDALARLDASIERSKQFWAEQEAARNADDWQRAWENRK
ncbi:MAG: hypothetical protein J7500_15595 [Sphingomonas sp.]|uniref:hypothetical protein n=1 Tax=Sphingomonas sp. TaxID=28214 RepID=UPI001B2EAF2F|nr:hypothetical protein [Sphingomonas sp.]MBO9624131.1 hypothetical protein [Sphingomonas sp.]